MPDVVDRETRSRMMAGIRSRDTRPEILIRKELHGRGFRYRLNVRKLPGTPDIVLPKYRAVVLVHGCFWHLHECPLFKWPSTRREWWRAKLIRNREVDERARGALLEEGWRIAIVWECALKGRGKRDITEVIDLLDTWLRSESTEVLEIPGRSTDV